MRLYRCLRKKRGIYWRDLKLRQISSIALTRCVSVSARRFGMKRSIRFVLLSMIWDSLLPYNLETIWGLVTFIPTGGGGFILDDFLVLRYHDIKLETLEWVLECSLRDFIYCFIRGDSLVSLYMTSIFINNSGHNIYWVMLRHGRLSFISLFRMLHQWKWNWNSLQ